MRRILALLLFSVLVAGCEGPVGPAGTAGLDGTDGAPGEPGREQYLTVHWSTGNPIAMDDVLVPLPDIEEHFKDPSLRMISYSSQMHFPLGMGGSVVELPFFIDEDRQAFASPVWGPNQFFGVHLVNLSGQHVTCIFTFERIR